MSMQRIATTLTLITFEGLMPKPGRYRAWTQFGRNDTVHTFSFTFEVIDVGQASAAR